MVYYNLSLSDAPFVEAVAIVAALVAAWAAVNDKLISRKRHEEILHQVSENYKSDVEKANKEIDYWKNMAIDMLQAHNDESS